MNPIDNINLFGQTVAAQGVNTSKTAAIGGGFVGGSAGRGASLLESNTSGLNGIKTDESVFVAASGGVQAGFAGSKLHLIG